MISKEILIELLNSQHRWDIIDLFIDTPEKFYTVNNLHFFCHEHSWQYYNIKMDAILFNLALWVGTTVFHGEIVFNYTRNNVGGSLPIEINNIIASYGGIFHENSVYDTLVKTYEQRLKADIDFFTQERLMIPKMVKSYFITVDMAIIMLFFNAVYTTWRLASGSMQFTTLVAEYIFNDIENENVSSEFLDFIKNLIS